MSDTTGSDGQGTPENGGTTDDAPQTFTQEQVNQLVGQARTDERRKAQQKFADYDDLKAKAGTASTAEERIANLEKEIASSRVEALRAKYAADVPEKQRPLLTGTTDDELKAQRELILEGVSDRKKQGNVAPKEGANPEGKPTDDMRDFTRELFGRAAAD